jgi:hypothetical protein
MLAIIGRTMISGFTVGTCYDGGAAESRWGGESGDLAGGGVYVWRQMRVKRRSGLGEATVVRTSEVHVCPKETLGILHNLYITYLKQREKKK